MKAVFFQLNMVGESVYRESMSKLNRDSMTNLENNIISVLRVDKIFLLSE